MENSNIQSINSNEVPMSNIQSVFQEYIDNGGEPKVTSFKHYLDKLINAEIKQLCGRSSKVGGDDWRNELKTMFGGRGSKWVFVSLENIRPTLDRLSAEGIDITDYDNFTQSHGQAWIRFSGGRINNGVQCAAFEVRTEGSTIDHPKQLHLIPMSDVNQTITFMNSTPHSMKVEEKTQPTEEEAVEIQIEEDNQIELQSELEQEDYEDAMGDIEELMSDEEDLDL